FEGVNALKLDGGGRLTRVAGSPGNYVIGRKLSTKPTSGGPHRMEKRARLKPPMDIPL
ncbi:hypothetical protein KXX13_002093, partial [Aspergillus fumigatus]